MRRIVAWAIGFLPPDRRTWSEAALAELDEADDRVRWALGVLACVAGAFVADSSVIVVAWSRSASAIAATSS